MLITGLMSSYLTLVMESQLRNFFESRVCALFGDRGLLVRRHGVALHRDALLQRVLASGRLDDGVQALLYVGLLLLAVLRADCYELEGVGGLTLVCRQNELPEEVLHFYGRIPLLVLLELCVDGLKFWGEEGVLNQFLHSFVGLITKVLYDLKTGVECVLLFETVEK